MAYCDVFDALRSNFYYLKYYFSHKFVIEAYTCILWKNGRCHLKLNKNAYLYECTVDVTTNFFICGYRRVNTI